RLERGSPTRLQRGVAVGREVARAVGVWESRNAVLTDALGKPGQGSDPSRLRALARLQVERLQDRGAGLLRRLLQALDVQSPLRVAVAVEARVWLVGTVLTQTACELEPESLPVTRTQLRRSRAVGCA